MKNLIVILLGVAIIAMLPEASALQVLDPDQDVNNPEGWTTAPLYTKINTDGLTNDDTTFITSNLLTTSSFINISLESGIYPMANQSSEHKIIWRSREQSSSGQQLTTVAEGFIGTERAFTSTEVELGPGFTDNVQYTLSSFDRARMTDYSNLTIEIYVSGNLALPRNRMEISEINFIAPEPKVWAGVLAIWGNGLMRIMGDGRLMIRG